MKTNTIVPSMFGVYVNFKIRVLQLAAVQLWGKMSLGKGGVKDGCIIYCWQRQQHVHTRTAQLSISQVGPPAQLT